jgi:hypothetical protein
MVQLQHTATIKPMAVYRVPLVILVTFKMEVVQAEHVIFLRCQKEHGMEPIWCASRKITTASH